MTGDISEVAGEQGVFLDFGGKCRGGLKVDGERNGLTETEGEADGRKGRRKKRKKIWVRAA